MTKGLYLAFVIVVAFIAWCVAMSVGTILITRHFAQVMYATPVR